MLSAVPGMWKTAVTVSGSPFLYCSLLILPSKLSPRNSGEAGTIPPSSDHWMQARRRAMSAVASSHLVTMKDARLGRKLRYSVGQTQEHHRETELNPWLLHCCDALLSLGFLLYEITEFLIICTGWSPVLVTRGQVF